MNRQNKLRIAITFFAASLIGVLSGCAGSGSENKVNIEGAVIIDVRTAQEFASGHLTGAINIDFNASDFEQKIKALNPAMKYIIYCRSGNRSAQAMVRIQELGFNDILDLGSVESASKTTGVEVIQ